MEEKKMSDIGKMCYITDKYSIFNGEWGVIKDFDGEYYHIAIANGALTLCIFTRKDIRIPRKQEFNGI